MTFPIKLDRTISIGNILTILSVVVSMLYWGSTVETRLAKHDLQIDGLTTQVKQVTDVYEKRFDKLEALLIQLYRSPAK